MKDINPKEIQSEYFKEYRQENNYKNSEKILIKGCAGSLFQTPNP